MKVIYIWKIHFYQFLASCVNLINMHTLQNLRKVHIFFLFWHDGFDVIGK